MTFAGFFVHLGDIPPVLRWLQWICPLKYTLEALSVNEVDSGLMIKDTLQGVPVDISATLIMNLVRFPHCLVIVEVFHRFLMMWSYSFSDLDRTIIIEMC